MEFCTWNRARSVGVVYISSVAAHPASSWTTFDGSFSEYLNLPFQLFSPMEEDDSQGKVVSDTQ
jgi:hypothetical protein